MIIVNTENHTYYIHSATGREFTSASAFFAFVRPLWEAGRNA